MGEQAEALRAGTVRGQARSRVGTAESPEPVPAERLEWDLVATS
jgi:hypothetical protein